MPVESEHRDSDSPYITRVWRGHASGQETMTSVATSTWELVFWEQGGVVHAAARGPETAASSAEISGDSASIGISFAHGASMPHLPLSAIVDGGIESPHVDGRTFVLLGEEWEVPDFDNAEQFVQKLVRAGVLTRDPMVEDVVWGGIARVGSRSVQRRVVHFDRAHAERDPADRACPARGRSDRRRVSRRSTSSIGSASTISRTWPKPCSGSSAALRRSSRRLPTARMRCRFCTSPTSRALRSLKASR